MVILRLPASQSPSSTLMLEAPPSFGIESVDELIAPHGPTEIRPFLFATTNVASSLEVDQLARTYLVYYSDNENPHTVVAELLSSSAIETAFVNERITMHYGATERVEPTDTQFPDVAGRRVRELINERRERGAYRVVWDGRNDRGSTVSSGVYFYKLVAGSFTDTKKMTILK